MSQFGFYEHTCRGANHAETWLTPSGTEFWLVFGDNPPQFTWIEYCPYCGVRPETLKEDWGKRTQEMISDHYEEKFCTSPVKNAYIEISE